ncbi:hypothetical protein ACNOYE_33445 [Nannocystaceae bacterium ST9]
MADDASEPAPERAAPERAAPERAAPEQWAVRASVVFALLLAIGYGLLAGGSLDFCLDDAWIHLAYAESLRLGDGLSYNPGDRETGFSSPLWVVLLAAWPSGSNPVIAVKLLGALLHAATAGLAATLALELGRARASLGDPSDAARLWRRSGPVPLASITGFAGLLTATSPTLLQSASSGMEVSLTAVLLLAGVLASVREQWLIASIAAALAELARPEALAFIGVFALILALARRQPRALLPILAAALALAAWVGYCLAVSGWPWPNTAYVKVGEPELAGGIAYLQVQVLPEQPWLIGLGGVVLIAAALVADLAPDRDAVRRFDLLALLAGWLLALLATAFSRPLDPDVLFYQSRYFAIFAALPPIAVALGLARLHRVVALICLVPIVVITGIALPRTHALQRSQERGIALLHDGPAGFVARELPADAVIAVEGAGAMRHHTPRSMTILDVMGLNFAAIAHAPDDAEKACVLVRAAPGWFVLPEHIAAPLSRVFVFRPLESFVDPRNAQVAEPHELRVWLLAVEGVRDPWRERCAASPSSD